VGVVTEEVRLLGTLCPRGIVKVDSSGRRPDRIVLVRLAWEEWTSPDL
jgi:hypothetical protein